jgi:hypothetical protein
MGRMGNRVGNALTFCIKDDTELVSTLIQNVNATLMIVYVRLLPSRSTYANRTREIQVQDLADAHQQKCRDLVSG